MTSNQTDQELLRLLGRYAEAYFSKTGEQLPEALADIEALIKADRQKREAQYISDIAYAIGYCKGMGQSSKYLENKYPDLDPQQEETQ